MQSRKDLITSGILFVLAGVILLTGTLVVTYYRSWVWDYWCHAGIIAELKHNPLDPRPFTTYYSSLIPYWPYLAFVTFVAKAFSLDAPTALGLMGVPNLLLWLAGFFIFSRTFISSAPLAPLFALISVLFLWGTDPWFFSAVYHFDVYWKITPYPSFFALALLLWTTHIFESFLKSGKPLLLSVAIVFSSIELLIHPITSIFLFVMLFSQMWNYSSKRGSLAFIAICFCSAFSAAFWPMYPLSQLIKANNFTQDYGASIFYYSVFSRIWPAVVLGVPALFYRILVNRRDPITIAVILLLPIYFYGYWTGKWNYGRVLSFAVLLSQLAVGGLLAEACKRKAILQKAGLMLSLAGLIFLGVRTYAMIKQEREMHGGANKSEYARFKFIADQTNPTDVIMADELSSMHLPAFDRKVAHFYMNAYFSSEEFEASRVARDRFFQSDDESEVKKIIERYSISAVVAGRDQLAKTNYTWRKFFVSDGADHDGLSLFKLRSDIGSTQSSFGKKQP